MVLAESIVGLLTGTVRHMAEGGVVAPDGDPYEYKQEGGVFYTRKKGAPSWIATDGKISEAISSKVFGGQAQQPVDNSSVLQPGLIPEGAGTAALDSSPAAPNVLGMGSILPTVQPTAEQDTMSPSMADFETKLPDTTGVLQAQDMVNALSTQVADGPTRAEFKAGPQMTSSAPNDFGGIDSISVRNNNPLNISDKGFGKVLGSEAPKDGDANISKFGTMEEGLAAFYAKTNYALGGKSKVFKPDMTIDAYNKKFATSKHAAGNFRSIAKSIFDVDIKSSDTLKKTIEKLGGVDKFSEVMAAKENRPLYDQMKKTGFYDRVTADNYEDILSGNSPAQLALGGALDSYGVNQRMSKYKNDIANGKRQDLANFTDEQLRELAMQEVQQDGALGIKNQVGNLGSLVGGAADIASNSIPSDEITSEQQGGLGFVSGFGNTLGATGNPLLSLGVGAAQGAFGFLQGAEDEGARLESARRESEISARNTIPDTSLFAAKGGPVDGATKQAESIRAFQTEDGEVITDDQGNIYDVHAKEKHEDMDKDLVTDILPEEAGVYVLSDQIKLLKEDLDAELGFTESNYSEHNNENSETEKVFLSDILGDEPMTVAEAGKIVRRKHKIVETGDINDIDRITNEENVNSRKIYVDKLKEVNERKRTKSGDAPSTDTEVIKLAAGGPVYPPGVLEEVKKMFPGKNITLVKGPDGNLIVHDQATGNQITGLNVRPNQSGGFVVDGNPVNSGVIPQAQIPESRVPTDPIPAVQQNGVVSNNSGRPIPTIGGTGSEPYRSNQIPPASIANTNNGLSFNSAAALGNAGKQRPDAVAPESLNALSFNSIGDAGVDPLSSTRTGQTGGRPVIDNIFNSLDTFDNIIGKGLEQTDQAMQNSEADRVMRQNQIDGFFNGADNATGIGTALRSLEVASRNPERAPVIKRPFLATGISAQETIARQQEATGGGVRLAKQINDAGGSAVDGLTAVAIDRAIGAGGKAGRQDANFNAKIDQNNQKALVDTGNFNDKSIALNDNATQDRREANVRAGTNVLIEGINTGVANDRSRLQDSQSNDRSFDAQILSLERQKQQLNLQQSRGALNRAEYELKLAELEANQEDLRLQSKRLTDKSNQTEF